jgi:DNA-binding NarL/FixJ family response regulator
MTAEIFILEDHPIFAAGLREMAEDLIPNCNVTWESTLEKALAGLRTNKPMLIISDLNLSDASGFGVLETLQTESPDSIVVGITGDTVLLEQYKEKQTDALFLLSKTAPIDDILKRVSGRITAHQAANDTPNERTASLQRFCGDPVDLTRKQKQVLQLIGEGLSNKEIARRMCVSPETVKSHAKTLFRQLGVKNRTQAAGQIKRLVG